MEIGLSMGYWSAGPPPGAEQLVATAEAEGLDSLWTAEAYGSDALTPLAWWGARTSKLKLGTSICQLSARTPTALAMAAMTMDHLCDGRFILGVGASGPQVVEGWYGQSFLRPLERTREYVEIMRKVWAREEPVTFQGQQFELPVHGGTGLGKALKSTLHPRRPDIPVFLGAEGPKNVALAAEIGDGWLPLWFSPKSDAFYRSALNEGFSRPGARHDAQSFAVTAMVPLVEHQDVDEAAGFLKPTLALYIGGMGSGDVNFHHDVFVRMGWGDVCRDVQALYLNGKKAEAAAAIPTALVEDVALLGPAEKIIEEIRTRWRPTCLTGVNLTGLPRNESRGAIFAALRG